MGIEGIGLVSVTGGDVRQSDTDSTVAPTSREAFLDGDIG